jgi:hypothetical protein
MFLEETYPPLASRENKQDSSYVPPVISNIKWLGKAACSYLMSDISGNFYE